MNKPLDILPIEPIVDRQSAFMFLLGILFNQQVRSDIAWRAPYQLGKRLDGFTPEHILIYSESEFTEIFGRSPAIHPFVQRMAQYTYAIAKVIVDEYDGDVRKIWTPSVPAGELVRRLVAMPGIGDHKARIALFVATVQLGIRVRDDGRSYSIRDCDGLATLFYPNEEPSLVL